MNGMLPDPELVKKLTDYLIEKFYEFIKDNRVGHVDGLAAVQSFYVGIINYIVEATGDERWRAMAVDLFKAQIEQAAVPEVGRELHD